MIYLISKISNDEIKEVHSTVVLDEAVHIKHNMITETVGNALSIYTPESIDIFNEDKTKSVLTLTFSDNSQNETQFIISSISCDAAEDMVKELHKEIN